MEDWTMQSFWKEFSQPRKQEVIEKNFGLKHQKLFKYSLSPTISICYAPFQLISKE
jgi:hypothetical protein